MNKSIIIEPEELAVVQCILREGLPDGSKVWVFGSRAGGRVKPWSDLDLLIEGPAPLSMGTLARLSDAFDESLLPWTVDLVDAHVSPEFANRIRPHAASLQIESAPA